MSEHHISRAIRLMVFYRANNCCEYCMSSGLHTTSEFQMEHIIPLAKNGKSISENLALACQGCNGHKLTKTHAIDPETQQKVSLYNPRMDSWKEHFCWSDDMLSILGLTPIGRATVTALNMNREKVINLRAVLKESRLHPPGHSL